jgi:hypothetical protein
VALKTGALRVNSELSGQSMRTLPPDVWNRGREGEATKAPIDWNHLNADDRAKLEKTMNRKKSQVGRARAGSLRPARGRLDEDDGRNHGTAAAAVVAPDRGALFEANCAVTGDPS